MLKNAVSSLPNTLYDDAGPLYGTVLPILTSVAVTPGVSAATALVATAIANVAAAM
jgi:hypothetical protein